MVEFPAHTYVGSLQIEDGLVIRDTEPEPPLSITLGCLAGLLLGKGNSIHFVPWDQVRTFQNKKPYKPFRGVLCEWFKLCSQAQRTSSKPVQPTAGGGG